ncbi:SPW repeat protein [Kitasatospora kifunensis]|uniref:SPW repeat-containing integral membrane domain-containing protein n=1 Tax=Kitasatospora kifunensis TaxID=58351 RepID=A0A7W7QWJ6_KITKI|nr:SPW repeat protein [Kitasatospora kifunensis]MBB4921069.1 hypothetical protein [Kitasatospora kifunensis]
MADVSQQSGDLSAHPDVSEMRARYARMLDGPQAVAVDGLVVLAGLYLAISGWVVHFNTTSAELTACNLIVGIAIALLGVGLTLAPARMRTLTWAAVVAGIWLIVSPWVATAGHHASAGMIWNNVITGVISCLLALIAARMIQGAAEHSVDGARRRSPRTR